MSNEATIRTSPQAPGEMRPVVKDRITVVDLVYHRPAFGGETFTSESRFGRELETFEQVYERKHLAIQEEWAKVDLGWITSCGMLVIQNEEGMFRQQNPTEEEIKRSKSKTIEVCCGEPRSENAWLVPAGETIRVVPNATDNIHVRCRSGKAYYTVRAFPS